MSLQNFKITDAQISQKGVVAAPDKLTGTSQENKAIFDRLIRETVKEEFNGLIDALDVIDAGKQDTIDDLETIRSGAAAGATAVQPEAGKGLFSGNYNDLTNKPNTVKWATFGVTSASQIYSDINNGYVVCCKYDSRVYVCENAHQVVGTSTYYAYLYSEDRCLKVSNMVWISDNANSLQTKGNMHTSVPDVGDNTHYPTTKAVRDALNEKQDAIDDLETIRSGAAAGATALQSVPNTYRTAEAQDVIDAGKVNTADYDPAEKTSAMTQPVGRDADGRLWTAPGGGGADGVTFTPSVDASGNISWTNDGGRQNPPTQNIKGPQGPQGPQGETGGRGARGESGVYVGSAQPTDPDIDVWIDPLASADRFVKTVNNVLPDENGNVNLTVRETPAVTGADEGKFLRVVSGAAAWQAVPQAEDEAF